MVTQESSIFRHSAFSRLFIFLKIPSTISLPDLSTYLPSVDEPSNTRILVSTGLPSSSVSHRSDIVWNIICVPSFLISSSCGFVSICRLRNCAFILMVGTFVLPISTTTAPLASLFSFLLCLNKVCESSPPTFSISLSPISSAPLSSAILASLAPTVPSFSILGNNGNTAIFITLTLVAPLSRLTVLPSSSGLDGIASTLAPCVIPVYISFIGDKTMFMYISLSSGLDIAVPSFTALKNSSILSADHLPSFMRYFRNPAIVMKHAPSEDAIESPDSLSILILINDSISFLLCFSLLTPEYKFSAYCLNASLIVILRYLPFSSM